MESTARYTPHQSKKRVFPGSSSSCMDPDVVEISPPMNWSSKSKSKIEMVGHHEVISIEPDDDPHEVIDEELDYSYKGKQSVYASHNNMTTIKSTDGVQSSKNIDVQGAHDIFGNGFPEHDFVYEDDFMNLFQDGAEFDDDYEFLQAQFDSIPTEVEAPVPWFTYLVENKNVDSVSSLNYPFSHGQLNDSSHAWQTQVASKPPYGTKYSSLASPKSFSNNNKSGSPASSHKLSSKIATSASCLLSKKTSNYPGSSSSKRKKVHGSSSHFPGLNDLGSVELPSKPVSYLKKSYPYNVPDTNSPGSSRSKWFKKVPGSSSHSPGLTDPYNVPDTNSLGSYRSKWFKKVPGSSSHSPGLTDLGSVELPSKPVSYLKKSYPYNVQNTRSWNDFIKNISEPGKLNLVNSVNAYLPKAMTMGAPFFNPSVAGAGHLSHEEMFGVNEAGYPAAGSTSPSGSTSTTKEPKNKDDIMKAFQLYKQFDTVEDYSDHHYSKNGSSVTQQPKAWAKRIQEEWKILEKDLPDTIFVRVYESRMDLLRAVIVGAQGTPYHDGLFFFDVFFPSGYPSVPPHVHYHSGGLRINPNLYKCGKVCLSLLNTWTGSGNEKWIPKVSTMLQVLVSIQALILNENPYFNEPGFARSAKSAAGEQKSQAYSENAFLLSLKTMEYTMRKPPKHFEDYVIGHFCKHVQDILGACKVYIEGGLAVGSVTKGDANNVVGNAKKCTRHFKGSVASHIRLLVRAFAQIGAKDCDEFLSLAPVAGANEQLPPYPPLPYFY